MRRLLQSILCVSLCPILAAQQEKPFPVQQSPAYPSDPPAASLAVAKVEIGTPVTLVALDAISTAKLKVGSDLRFAVADDVVVQGVVAIPRGTPVQATVTHVTAASKAHHRDGRIQLRLKDVNVGNNLAVRLTGKDDFAPVNLKEHRNEKTKDLLVWILLAPVVVLFSPLIILMAIATLDVGGKPEGKDLDLSPCFHASVWVRTTWQLSKAHSNPSGTPLLAPHESCPGSSLDSNSTGIQFAGSAANGDFKIE